VPWDDVPIAERPTYHGKISLHPSAVATFYAPSDVCGIGGMHSERIRAVPTWRKAGPRYDCVFVNIDSSVPGMRGLDVARIRQFFSFKTGGKYYPCAFVQWLPRIGDEPDEETGLWEVWGVHHGEAPHMDIIHVDTIIRAAHLIGVYGEDFVPVQLSFHEALNAFHSFYVNKFIDHHASEIAF